MIYLLENFRRINKDVALRIFTEEFKNLTKDLSVNLDNIGFDRYGWVYVDFSGADSELLTEIFKRKCGIANTNISALNKEEIIRGIVVDSTVGYGIYVDVCLRSSSQTDALYPLHVMRSQLAYGEKVPARQISKHFCLEEGFPLEVRVTNIDKGSRKIDVELSDRQVSYFNDWIRFPFDRVILIGCSRSDLENTVERSGLRRDIANIESLSLTTQVLICKLGTQAPGVISSIGPHLKGINARAFQPGISWTTRQMMKTSDRELHETYFPII